MKRDKQGKGREYGLEARSNPRRPAVPASLLGAMINAKGQNGMAIQKILVQALCNHNPSSYTMIADHHPLWASVLSFVKQGAWTS